MACILRNVAESPERAAELDVNEGICDVLDLRFPPPGTLVTPEFPAPTNARSFVILRLLGVFAGCLAQAVGGGGAGGPGANPDRGVHRRGGRPGGPPPPPDRGPQKTPLN